MTATLIDQLKTTPVADPVRRAGRSTRRRPRSLIDGVSKRSSSVARSKPVAAITDVSMRLERGDIHGILGANGSGKSTLIRLISGPADPRQGSGRGLRPRPRA